MCIGIKDVLIKRLQDYVISHSNVSDEPILSSDTMDRSSSDISHNSSAIDISLGDVYPTHDEDDIHADGEKVVISTDAYSMLSSPMLKNSKMPTLHSLEQQQQQQQQQQ